MYMQVNKHYVINKDKGKNIRIYPLRMPEVGMCIG